LQILERQRAGDVLIERDVPARMRDGISLRADVYRPASGGTHPVLLMRQPYGKGLAQSQIMRHPIWYARQGYVVVVQDIRGRWDSEGEFDLHVPDVEDGYDSVEWAAQLDGSNGRVGMYGNSFGALTQLQAAIARPPHLVAIAPAMSTLDFYRYRFYRNGMPAIGFMHMWATTLGAGHASRLGDHREAAQLFSTTGRRLESVYGHLPLREAPGLTPRHAPMYHTWLDHQTYDDYWKQISMERRLSEIEVPAIHFGGWYDLYCDSTVRAYTGLRERAATQRARESQYLLFGPWGHGPVLSQFIGDRDFGPDAIPAVDEEIIRWYDHWLKQDRPSAYPAARARIFVLGDNQWREFPDWPPADTTPTSIYISSTSGATSTAGDGRLVLKAVEDEQPDTYVYNPRNPVPSFAGKPDQDPARNPIGPIDHQRIETRNDVLVYTGEPLDARLELAGWVTVELWASSSATDTAFTAKLLEVLPDGRAYNLCDSIIRAASRDSVEDPQPLVPFTPYRFSFEVGPIHAAIRTGHRLRLEISSSNYPAYARHLNYFGPLDQGTLEDARYATQLVYHDREHPSRIVLPVRG
jgi:putative CocE/NonD family hydrolase